MHGMWRSVAPPPKRQKKISGRSWWVLHWFAMLKNDTTVKLA